MSRLRSSDMPIATIRRNVEIVDQGAAIAPERLTLMHAHRASVVRRLQDLQLALAILDYKITTYGASAPHSRRSRRELDDIGVRAARIPHPVEFTDDARRSDR